jgi:hypothetical protein
LFVLLVVAAAAGARAEDAFAVPLSDRVIKAELTWKDGTKAEVAIRDGMWATVHEPGDAFYFAFSAIVNDKTGQPNFQVYKILEEPSGEEHAVRVTRAYDIPVGRSFRYRPADGVVGAVKGIEVWEFADLKALHDPLRNYTPAELQADYGVSGNGICCTECDGRLICANKVSCGDASCDGGGGIVY